LQLNQYAEPLFHHFASKDTPSVAHQHGFFGPEQLAAHRGNERRKSLSGTLQQILGNRIAG
jgi:hypothetical protein